MLLAACGAGSPSPADRLQGDWITDTSQPCALAAVFTPGQLELDSMCVQLPSSLDLQAVAGSATITDSKITFTPTIASCPASVIGGTTVFTYSFVGSALRLGDASGFSVMNRIAPSGSPGGSVTFGCFDSAGAFTAMPVMPL